MRSHGTRGLIVGLVLAACGAPPRTAPPAVRTVLRLTTEAFAREHSHKARHVDRPFRLAEKGLSGTGLLLAFLQDAEAWGASYVSDVSYSLQMAYNGKHIECVSKLALDDGSAARAEASATPDEADGEPEYTTTVKAWRPRATEAWVVDRELVCQEHAHQVPGATPEHENRYEASIGLYIMPGAGRIDDTKIEFYNECTYQPNRRHVRRYEHFIAARFSPPDVALIEHRYADAPLIQEPPLCHEIEVAPGQPLRQHITANVHFPATAIVPATENEIVPWALRSVGGER